MSTVPFCESWYLRATCWYWILFVGGHPILYSLFVLCYFLVTYFPLNDLFLATLLAMGCSFLLCTWLPFGYIFLRTERKEFLPMILFQMGAFVALIAVIVSVTLASIQETDYESYLPEIRENLMKEFDKTHSSTMPGWFSNFQRSYECCGLRGVNDYRKELEFLNPPTQCNFSSSDLSKLTKGCLSDMVRHRRTSVTMLKCLDVFLLLGALVSSILQIVSFAWLKKQPLMVITGSVYLRTVNDDLIAYPEVDSSEAVSVSSDDE